MDVRAKGRHRCFAIAFIIALVIVFSATTNYTRAMTAAHSVIDNRARATYVVDGLERIAYSNWVMLSVLPVADITVFPVSSPGRPTDGGFVFAAAQHVVPGQTVVIPYRLTNSGNSTDTIILSTDLIAVGPLPDASVVIYADANENGQPDGNEREINGLTLSAGESAALLVVLTMPTDAPAGSGYYVALQVQSGVDGNVSVTNTWSSLTVTDNEPIVRITRTVSVDPRSVNPPVVPGSVHTAGEGATLRHTITLQNAGYALARDVVVIDALDTNERLLPHAFGTDLGVEISGIPHTVHTSPDGFVRLTAAADGTQQLTFTWPELASGQQLVVVYDTRVQWSSPEAVMKKTAYAVYTPPSAAEQKVPSNTVVVSPAGHYGVRLLPFGAALAPGERGRQRASRAAAGEQLRFSLVVTNTGTLPATVALTITPQHSGWITALFAADGFTPLPGNETKTLLPGESQTVVVGVAVPTSPFQFNNPPYEFKVRAHVTEKPTAGDVSFIHIDNVQALTPQWEPLALMADTTSGAAAGGLLTYALLFGNDSDHPAYDVTIVQPLSPVLGPPAAASGETGLTAALLEAVALSPAAAFSVPDVPDVTATYDAVAHTVVWQLPVVPPRSGGRLVLRAPVDAAAPAGTVITMQGRITAAGMDDARYTNVVQHVVLGAALHVELAADQPTVMIGDVNTYTVAVQNVSTSVPIADAHVTVTLPAGLTYRAPAVLNGHLAPQPYIDGNVLVFSVGTLAAGATVQLNVPATVNAAAAHALTVTGQARGALPSGVRIESPVASIQTAVRAGLWSEAGMVTGTVSWDGQPLAGVQVVLDNGRFAVSDMGGRFTLAGVSPGRRAVRLEPASLAAAIATASADTGSGDGRPTTPGIRLTVYVLEGGMALANFNLPAHSGAAKAPEGDDR